MPIHRKVAEPFFKKSFSKTSSLQEMAGAN